MKTGVMGKFLEAIAADCWEGENSKGREGALRQKPVRIRFGTVSDECEPIRIRGTAQRS